ncbi:PaaI family thioesterase [Bradyrhizobium diazoefficiens]
MHELTKTAAPPRPELHVATEGEFKGWQTWIRDSFENHIGPFWHRLEADGSVRCAFRVEKKHLNGSGNVHGGCFMAFADYCLFAIGRNALNGRGVTVNFACEFLDAGHEGELIECTGEVSRAGGSLIFLRGQMASGERLLFTFSRAKRKSLPQPNA